MSTVTEEVVYTGILTGEPSRLLFQKELKGKSGRTRLFVEAVPIPDAQMLCRVEKELQPHDRIELTVEYDYAKPGLPSKIVDYRKVLVSPAAPAELAAA